MVVARRMADEDGFGPVSTFVSAWLGLTLAVFPLVATLEQTAFGGSLGGLVVMGICVVVTIPAALEFLFSDRNPRLVATFVVVFIVLYLLAIVGQTGVYFAVGVAEPIPAVEFAVLFTTYGLTYWLVYRTGLARIKQAVTR